MSRLNLIPIGEVSEVKSGFAFKSEDYLTEGTKLIRIGNLDGIKLVFNDSTVFVSNDVVQKASEFLLKENDVLIAMSGATTGKVALVKDSDLPCLLNQRVGRFTVNQNKLNPKYLFYYLADEKVKERILKVSGGSAQPNISPDQLKKIKIPLPDLKTQQQIAEVLEQADRARQQRKTASALTNEFLQSSFLSLFGDPVKNDKRWEMKKVEDIAVKEKNGIKAGPFGSSLKKEFYVSKGYRIYGQEQVIKDDLTFGDYYIDEERYKTLESCKVQSGDVLISLVGTYGKITIVPEQFEPGIINPRLMKITPNKKIINPIFFKFLLTSDAVRKQIEHFSRGGTMDIVNVGIMKEIKIYLPPLSLQQQFASIVEQAEQLRQKQKQSEQELEQLFQSLLQKYFG